MSSRTGGTPSSPQELTQRFKNACDLHEDGLFNKAIALYQELITCLPDSSLLHFNCGLALYDMQRFEEAEEYYLRASEISNEDPDIFYNQGLNYRGLGKHKKGAASFKQAVKLGDTSVDTLYNLALCYHDLDDTNEASRLYEEILSREPGHQSTLNNYAYLCHKSGNLEKAESLYKKLLQENPGHQSAEHMLNSLGGKSVDSAPLSYVEEVFDNYAKDFEQSLVEKLQYNTPQGLWDRYCLICAEEPRAYCLDLGCGTGLAGELFVSCSREITGVDISAEMLTIAGEKDLYRELVKDDISHFLQTAMQHYDLILAADVFTYLGDLEEIFTACFANTTDSGVFLFSVEESTNDGFALKESGRFGHSVTYIQALCQKSGWTLLDCHPSKLRQDKGEWIKGFLYILQK